MSDKYTADSCVVAGYFLWAIGNYFGKILIVTDSNKIIRLRLYLDYIIDDYIIDNDKKSKKKRERKP